jgi:hypothetical protein
MLHISQENIRKWHKKLHNVVILGKFGYMGRTPPPPPISPLNRGYTVLYYAVLKYEHFVNWCNEHPDNA